MFLGAKAPLELAHVKNNKKNNGTENFMFSSVVPDDWLAMLLGI